MGARVALLGALYFILLYGWGLFWIVFWGPRFRNVRWWQWLFLTGLMTWWIDVRIRISFGFVTIQRTKNESVPEYNKK
jgi:hypothetical protein